MNILVISTNRNAYPVPVLPAGACMVAEAVERAGHAVRLLDLMFLPDPVRAVQAALSGTKYDVVGISVRNIDNIVMGQSRFFITELVSIIDAIRKIIDAPVVLGGAALMIMPEEILRVTRSTCAVIGNGESVFPRLISKLVKNRSWDSLPGIAYLDKDSYRANAAAPGSFCSCSGPDYRRWLDMKAYGSCLSTIPVQTKQGCPFQCVYCTYQKIEGSSYQLADPGSVAGTALRFASSGLHDIEFVDNVFNAPYDHALAVCESLIRAKPKARFQSVEMSPASFDHRLLSTMERAGFVGIGLTVESASDTVLAGLKKGFSSRDVHIAAEVVNSHQMPCLWIFLFGGPGETRETVRETLRFAETSIRPQDAAFFNVGIRMYPGTGLEAIARTQGLLSVPAADMLAPLFYISPEVEADWIIDQVKHSMQRHMNFSDKDSFSFRYLPQISRMGHRLGLQSPLWRYTRFIRRGLRSVGMQV
jgi:radical SAM superfamily enzyme YgiQ (UPF0313 family)